MTVTSSVVSAVFLAGALIAPLADPPGFQWGVSVATFLVILSASILLEVRRRA